METASRWRAEGFVLAGVALVHSILISAWVQPSVHRTVRAAEDAPRITEVRLLPSPGRRLGEIPLPRVKLVDPRISLPTLTDIHFMDPDADRVPGVTGPESVPHPEGDTSLDTSLYAARAGLIASESVTVVLSVEVRADGSVGEVGVLTGSGNPAVDGEAVRYALAIRWVPGSWLGHAVAMRIRFPVTLKGMG